MTNDDLLIVSMFRFFAQVAEAANLLHEYNTRLVSEMDERKTLQAMLKAYQGEQKDLLTQAEERLEVWHWNRLAVAAIFMRKISMSCTFIYKRFSHFCLMNQIQMKYFDGLVATTRSSRHQLMCKTSHFY